jgi:aquaporin Z
VPNIGKAALAEFIGTLGIVFVATAAATSGKVGLDATGVALASGLIVAVMVTATLAISGGHLNPAVTLGVLIAGKLDALTSAVYIVVQLLGAAVGALLTRALLPGVAYDAARGGAPALGPDFGAGKAIAVEAVVAFVWVFAYLRGSSGDEGDGHRSLGVTIGLLVVAGTLAFALYTGAAFNPARWFGPAFASGLWTNAHVWTVGPLAGGVVAALAHVAIGRTDGNRVEPAG